MNINLAMQIKAGNERRAVFFNGGIKIPEKINSVSGIKISGMPDAYVIDGSLNEIIEMKQSLYRLLTGGGVAEPKTFEQLHSEILEKYEGEEREKHIAALNIAQNELDIFHRIKDARMASMLNPKEIYSKFNENISKHLFVLNEQPDHDYWNKMREELFGSAHYLDPRFTQTVGNANDNGLILSLGHKIFTEMLKSGLLENGMAMYEKIRKDLIENFSGDEEELNARLEALDRGFVKAGESFAKMSAGFTMVSSPHYTPITNASTVLTPKQATANARIEAETAKLTEHITNMFRAALDFYKTTGSFAGFFDSKEANIPGTLSLRDTEHIFRASLSAQGEPSHENVLNIPGLSVSGKSYLQKFFIII
jgi:hypothetical protein